MADYILKNMNVSVDGRGYAGEVEEWTPPVPVILTEELRAGGMDAPISLDMGMEALKTSLSFAGINPQVLKTLGAVAGGSLPVTGRGALEDKGGEIHAAIVKMRGKVARTDMGAWKPGQKSPLSVDVNLDYYSLEIDGEVLHEIDIPNMKRVINGVDQLAGQRKALGI